MPEHPLIAQGQRAMLDFLSADLELAFTMLKFAEIDAPMDPERSRITLAAVQAALTTIRSFEPRIMNQEAWSAISARADELEAAIAKVAASRSGTAADEDAS